MTLLKKVHFIENLVQFIENLVHFIVTLVHFIGISSALYSSLYCVLLHFIGFTVNFTDTLWRFRRHRKVKFLEPCFFGHTEKFKGLLSFPSSSHRYALNSKHEKYFFSEGIFFMFSQNLVTGGGKNCFHNL